MILTRSLNIQPSRLCPIHLGNERTIRKLVAEERGLAAKIVDKIGESIGRLAGKSDGYSRAERKRLDKALELYLNAAAEAGNIDLSEKILTYREREEEEEITDTENTEQPIEKEAEMLYNRKRKYLHNNVKNYYRNFNFLHKNFPPENERKSEAHRLAVWWASKESTKVGDRTLISMNDRWYLVEKFEDALNHYQVEAFIPKNEFNAIYKEIRENGRSGRIQSIQSEVDEDYKRYRQSYSVESRGTGSDSNSTRYNRENSEMVQLDSRTIDRGERPSSDGRGSRESSSSYRQGLDLKESTAINQDEEKSNSKFSYSLKHSENGSANDGLKPYNEEMISLIEDRGDYILDSYSALESFVNLAFDKPTEKATGYFGNISAKDLERIKNSIPNLPKELDGKLFKEGKDYSIIATLDSVRHLVDEKDLTREDVLDYLDRLADTILNFDSVTYDVYIDSYGNKNNGLLFKKSFEDGKQRSFNIVSNKKRSLSLITTYLERTAYEKKKFAETLPLNNTTAHTLKAGVSQTSNTSISENEEKVNSDFEYSKKPIQKIPNSLLKKKRKCCIIGKVDSKLTTSTIIHWVYRR